MTLVNKLNTDHMLLFYILRVSKDSQVSQDHRYVNALVLFHIHECKTHEGNVNVHLRVWSIPMMAYGIKLNPKD